MDELVEEELNKATLMMKWRRKMMKRKWKMLVRGKLITMMIMMTMMIQTMMSRNLHLITNPTIVLSVVLDVET
jgi:hypothetical protein